MEYPSILKPNTLKEVLQNLPKQGVPTRFSREHLVALGHKSSNDRPVIPILKFIGFLDSSEAPTERYKNYRGKDGARILGDGIRSGYSELFQLYPDANRKDAESLNHFFATKTSGGERTLQAMVQTFKTLCSLAEFDSAPEGNETPAAMNKRDSSHVAAPAVVSSNSFPVNINIELQIPATSDAEIYEKFFAAMKKHLLQ